MNQGQAFGQSPYPPAQYPPAPYPAEPNFHHAPAGPAPGMWPGGPGPEMHAQGPGPFGAAPMATNWNTNAAAAPPPPNPNAAPPGGDAIGFNFHGNSLPGYIDSSLNPTIQPPTNPYFTDDTDQDQTNQEDRPLLPAAAIPNEDEIKVALEKYAKNKCCYGQPNGIVLGEVEMKSGFKYNLTSNTETRETVWEFEPYVAQRVDGPSGPLPGPWALEVHPNSAFKKDKKEIQIPGTASIKQCHTCCGNGHSRCTACTGMGGSKCTWCHGTGNNAGTPCNSCTGTGHQRCTRCTGQGMETCTTCKGKRSLFTYLKLIVKWDVVSDDFVSASSAIPNDYLTKRSRGIQVVNESGRRCVPLSNFPDEAINSTSQRLIQKQVQGVMPSGAIREQKQSVEMIRIAEVKYTWDGKSGAFYMFGIDNRIYFAEYPKSCCCGCSCCTIT